MAKPKISEIFIRFNTKNNGSNLIWRIFIDNEEFLASSISLKGMFWDKKTVENEVDKYNIACFGYVLWDNTSATIISKPSKSNKFQFLSKKEFFNLSRLID